ncbi:MULTISPECIES: hypothetical protein [unclassified Mycolicibacterium]|uniref:hypothetical protein n=1 Tax=unclassified Mycolicibacterium TaxID=2636767 RepID=UPI0012DEDAF1|nr:MULTISPECIES: hypothetical protein [unclassified Mycolicibacterium]MUL81205.1 hypothetical protein [Mycolicibacterium sp. CBMA 329]MUL86971.1 hypothetical protein [Mycolicibacterium sp. CBMA 331]MUL98745.1 hypothetical protein [Mycolicibacterium sp. CBMA 334]MUM25606.1 hypothetical protein [Mycolicibacterium sp. CBMA 295]MUM37268.1 hypothetical protein [Mycolicibacterium sp. CBMA 247]
MASTKYIGYVGGVAVAAGVGAAIAVAGQGTAHADSTDGAAKESTSSTSQHVKAGPKRGESKAGETTRAKPLSKVKDSVKENLDKQAEKIEKAAAHVTKSVNAVSTSITDSLDKAVKPAKPVAVKPKPSAEEFEAEQVAKLKGLFSLKQAAAPKPDPVVADKPDTETAVKPVSKAIVTPKVSAVQTQADTATNGPAWDPNPFRADDPDPTDFPEPIMKLRQALLDASPDALDPFVREATEQIYRGSQMVPWVNAVIPIGKIVENLAPAVGSGPAALDARQTIINELIKTTPPGSFVYYGYDLVADVINLEAPAADLKVQAVATVWDLLDPLHLAHNPGKSGIGGSAG